MRVTALVLAACAAWGQGGVGGVRSGLVFDAPSAGVRVVEGMPGAAHLGVSVAGELEAASMSPSGRAMVARQAGVWIAVRGLGSEDAERRELGVEPRGIQWSPRGRYAAIASEGRVGVWDFDVMAWVQECAVEEGREVTNVAVDEEGGLWAGFFDGQMTRLAAWREGAWMEAGHVPGRGAVAAGAGLTALAGAGEIAVFAGGSEIWRAATEREDAPVGVAFRGGDVVAAFAGGRPELVWWPERGGEAQRMELEAVPRMLEAVAAGDGLVLRQREREGDEIWVAVRRGGGWMAFFVPAGE